MENFDIKTVIYFLIAIVWFIYSVFKKSQKKAERPAQPTPTNYDEGEDQMDVKTLLEEILAGKKDEVKEKEVIPRDVFDSTNETKEKKKTTKPFYSDTSIKAQSLRTPKTTPTTSSRQAEKIFEIQEEYRNDMLADFDPQKAMIYSEILKRPQY